VSWGGGNAHRELLTVLSSVTLDDDEEADLKTEVAAAHASAAAKVAAVAARASATEEAVSTTCTLSAEGQQKQQQQADEADELIASIPLVASQPPTEYVNHWDREVYHTIHLVPGGATHLTLVRSLSVIDVTLMAGDGWWGSFLKRPRCTAWSSLTTTCWTTLRAPWRSS
jgi:hypothetical protein